MEKKQARHAEWGRVQIAGQGPPIMAGAAIGAAQLMWVACRTAKNLVHVFQDGRLLSIWRFTSDPRCIIFGPSSKHHAGGAPDDTASSKGSDATLLVFTFDGRIWRLELSSDFHPLHERPTKKTKETFPSVLTEEGRQNANVLYASGEEEKRRARDGGGAFSQTENCAAGDGGRDSSSIPGLHLQWTKVAVQSKGSCSRKIAVRAVSDRALLGLGPSVSVAARGPGGIVVLCPPSGALSVMQLRLAPAPGRPSVMPVSDECHSMRRAETTCALFVSAMLQADASAREDNALVNEKLFKCIFGDVHGTNPAISLLEGDPNGSISAISVDHLGRQGKSRSSLVCNLAQPILAILSIPIDKLAGCKVEQTGSAEPSKAEEPRGDLILILGQLGQVILITGVRQPSSESENGPFLPASKSFSWQTKEKGSAAAQLSERGIIVHEWNLDTPIRSACMVNPCRLCYSSESKIQFVDLFETMGGRNAPPKSRTAGYRKGAATPPAKSFAQKTNLTDRTSEASLPESERVGWAVNKELVPRSLPVADVVVEMVGRGVLGSPGGSRPLVVLTGRGRLLGVEVSDHVSTITLSQEVEKGWRSLQAKKEDQVENLLETLSEVTNCTVAVQRHQASITLALRELADAFPVVYDVCSRRAKEVVRCPNLGMEAEESPSQLRCSLDVTAQPSTLISPESLSFGPSLEEGLSSHVSIPQAVRICITLSNDSPSTVSPYWSLVLDLQSLSSDSSEAMTHSIVINRGLGLPAGAQWGHEFVAELPKGGFCPLLASVYLCHLHDPHSSIMGFRPPSLGASIMAQSHSAGMSKKLSDMTGRPPSIRLGSSIGNSKTGVMNEPPAPENSGSICMLLACYRIDLLSLIGQPPPRAGLSPWTYPKRIDSSEQVDATSSDNDQYLGTFLGNVGLPQISNPMSNVMDSGNFWPKLRLGDLIQKGVLSKAGDRKSASAPDGGTISIWSKCPPAGERISAALQFQASSLLLGSLLREALMWRTSGIGAPPNGPADVPESRRTGEDSTENIRNIALKLQTMSGLWTEALASRDQGLFMSLVDDARCAAGAVLQMYRRHRAS